MPHAPLNPSTANRFNASVAEQARTPPRLAIAHHTRLPEVEVLTPLLEEASLPPALAVPTAALAERLMRQMRNSPPQRRARVQDLMQEYALSSDEGIALMCLAEALLRIPDSATRDALIRSKIGSSNWKQHLGKSTSLFVNATTWGLLITGKLVNTRSENRLEKAMIRLVGMSGEPLIRKGVDLAMRMLGEQFVTGETIAEALENAKPLETQGFRYSYDMLGEAALTAADADRYYRAYEAAIDAIGSNSQQRGPYREAGISIKLSALHPRYSRAQRDRVMGELYPRLLTLAEKACHYHIGLNIDAEESERLSLSLDVFETLCHAPSLAGWNGLGFVVQAYQKRCPAVIDHLIALARASKRRLMLRLVKGAYWDSEIKRAQQDGLSDYPVFTRKHHTDVCYLACARRLLAASDAVYPQFATHNANTLAAIYHLAGGDKYDTDQYEFQCLHGMGETLYSQVVVPLNRPCRIYAPVGSHDTLLAYLVRRLLENGANTSFVNLIADSRIDIAQLLENPVAATRKETNPGTTHPRIPLPPQLYGSARTNSPGIDLNDDANLFTLQEEMQAAAQICPTVYPLLASGKGEGLLPATPHYNPADSSDKVCEVREASTADISVALNAAEASSWGQTPVALRAACLEKMAEALITNRYRCLSLLVREAGKTWAHAVLEWREAVDFLRYYASEARRNLTTPGMEPLGVVLCISPWNFPLAIFTGQIAAALAAGNAVLAKPADQTPAIAALVVEVFRNAGLPADALQLLPGSGLAVGAPLAADRRVAGVLFTGSTATAKLIQQALAERSDEGLIPLIAETGGQNVMVVDSSALLEQVAADAIASAFEAAGQRCSALRVLCVQEDIAPRLLAMLQGAMAECRLGAPSVLQNDIGPVIDEAARHKIETHIAAMAARGFAVHRHCRRDTAIPEGSYVEPCLIEIPDFSVLAGEVFGPVLHFITYPRDHLPTLMTQVAATNYALTFGVHSRIDETINTLVATSHAGNVYVNRNMVGAVVGVQPFGGDRLSGTGPKAGGPLYLLRLVRALPPTAAWNALRASAALGLPVMSPGLLAFYDHLLAEGELEVARNCMDFVRYSTAGLRAHLPGPTGEDNLYLTYPRERVLCLGGSRMERLRQLAAVLALGGKALWGQEDQRLYSTLPEAVQKAIELGTTAGQAMLSTAAFDAVLLCGSTAQARDCALALAQRPGPIVPLALMSDTGDLALERLLGERSICVNTTAAGGNASLMSLT